MTVKAVTKKAAGRKFVSLNADPKKAAEAGYVAGYLARGNQLVSYRTIDLSIPEGALIVACKRFDGASSIKLPNGDAIVVGMPRTDPATSSAAAEKALALLGLAA